MNQNERAFENKFPGKRLEILKFLKTELTRFRQIGFPDYDLSNPAAALTKHIISIMEDN